MTTKPPKVIRRLSIRQRREIYDSYFNTGERVWSPEELAREYGVSKWVIYNIINQRVKLSKSPRSDKGTKKGRMGRAPSDNPVNPADLINDGWSTEDHLRYQCLTVLDELPRKRINLIEKSKILTEISRIQRQLKEQEIEAHIKRADAQVLARIIRRFMPEATEMDVIKIFREELDRWKNEN